MGDYLLPGNLYDSFGLFPTLKQTYATPEEQTSTVHEQCKLCLHFNVILSFIVQHFVQWFSFFQIWTQTWYWVLLKTFDFRKCTAKRPRNCSSQQISSHPTHDVSIVWNFENACCKNNDYFAFPPRIPRNRPIFTKILRISKSPTTLTFSRRLELLLYLKLHPPNPQGEGRWGLWVGLL